ncbi:MAG: uroporphyrinogen decarboxylase, partial [Acidimicrobiaceae bacterium]|nr:uroporphyrinogen decarboxylase [Acidimicrobiaceae bacterium]
RRGVAPHSARVLEAVGTTRVPRIHFGVGTGELLDEMGGCGAEVVGVDFRVPIDEARRRVGPGRALQGNLDPAVVLAGEAAACEAARAVLAANGGHPGFVFNLGHGVLPSSDPDVLARVVQLVHDEGDVRTE